MCFPQSAAIFKKSFTDIVMRLQRILMELHKFSKFGMVN